MQCSLCPRCCSIEDGQTGFCGVRRNQAGKIVLATYGQTTGLAIDPIEKKPLYHFYPGSRVLSLGSIGCNLACEFCQNWSTAQSRDLERLTTSASPEEIVRLAKESDCINVAFTYNEPTIWAEYAMDVAAACRQAGLKTVAVSNGFISNDRRTAFFDLMDAANIDLKSFSDEFYRKHCNASLEPVLETLRHLARSSKTWLEVTTLIIPTLNDSDTEVAALSAWIAKNLSVETPLHLSAFRPAYHMTTLPPTPPQALFHTREIALSCGLKNVYTGNIDDPAGQATYCPQCAQTVISRFGYDVDEYMIDEDFCCKYCGQTISGRFDDEDIPEPAELETA